MTSIWPTAADASRARTARSSPTNERKARQSGRRAPGRDGQDERVGERRRGVGPPWPRATSPPSASPTSGCAGGRRRPGVAAWPRGLATTWPKRTRARARPRSTKGLAEGGPRGLRPLPRLLGLPKAAASPGRRRGGTTPPGERDVPYDRRSRNPAAFLRSASTSAGDGQSRERPGASGGREGLPAGDEVPEGEGSAAGDRRCRPTAHGGRRCRSAAGRPIERATPRPARAAAPRCSRAGRPPPTRTRACVAPPGRARANARGRSRPLGAPHPTRGARPGPSGRGGRRSPRSRPAAPRLPRRPRGAPRDGLRKPPGGPAPQ
jgi:hypothetical protein